MRKFKRAWGPLEAGVAAQVVAPNTGISDRDRNNYFVADEIIDEIINIANIRLSFN